MWTPIKGVAELLYQLRDTFWKIILKVIFVIDWQPDRQLKYNAKAVLIICKQVFLGFCHYLVVGSSRMWALLGADSQSSCSLEGFHSIKFSYPKWNHYKHTITTKWQQWNSGLHYFSLSVPACLPVVSCSERFLEPFLKYMTMWQQRHCSFMFREPVFKITLKTCYHWRGFTLLVSLEWPETLGRLWPTSASRAAQLSAPVRLCELPLTGIMAQGHSCVWRAKFAGMCLQ